LIRDLATLTLILADTPPPVEQTTELPSPVTGKSHPDFRSYSLAPLAQS